MEAIYENLLEHIRAAKIQADKKNIAANMIILDTGVAITNGLYLTDGFIDPTIWGMKVKYQSKLADDYNVNFAILHTNAKSRFEALEKENKFLKETIKKIIDLLNEGNYEV